jgi:hypothetical protein
MGINEGRLVAVETDDSLHLAHLPGQAAFTDPTMGGVNMEEGFANRMVDHLFRIVTAAVGSASVTGCWQT